MRRPITPLEQRDERELEREEQRLVFKTSPESMRRFMESTVYEDMCTVFGSTVQKLTVALIEATSKGDLLKANQIVGRIGVLEEMAELPNFIWESSVDERLLRNVTKEEQKDE